jgi:hypothetical protein
MFCFCGLREKLQALLALVIKANTRTSENWMSNYKYFQTFSITLLFIRNLRKCDRVSISHFVNGKGTDNHHVRRGFSLYVMQLDQQLKGRSLLVIGCFI